MTKKLAADIAAFLLAALAVGGFAYYAMSHALEPRGADEVPIGATVYEDGSWVAPNGESGCLKGGLCND